MKDCRKTHKINKAVSKKLLAPAPVQQPAPPLAIQGPPVAAAVAAPPQQQAAAAYAQHQPRQEDVRFTEDQYPLVRRQLNMIQKGRPSNRCQKLISRQVYQAMASPPAVPDYLRGLETEITFSREDHLPAVPLPGHAALVVKAHICDFKMTKVFMDGGS